MKKYTIYFLALAVSGLIACGPSGDDKRAEEENRKEEVDAMFEELEAATDTLKQGDSVDSLSTGDTVTVQ